MKLPKSFISIAGKYGVKEEDIIFAAMADFDMEYRFADTIVALSKNKLLVAAYPYQEKNAKGRSAEYRFGGYGGWQIEEDMALSQEPALQIHRLEEVENLEVLRQVATGVLMAKIDGVERNVCHFSNTRMGTFLKLCSLLQKLKKGEEITKEAMSFQLHVLKEELH